MRQALIRVGVYWHVFPTYSEAKDSAWRDPSMLFDILPPQLIAKKNESELVIYLKNGSILQLKGADNPVRLKGAGPVGVVLDEFATMKYETWTEVVQPIIRANNGWCWFVGTPKGKNHLFEVYQRGQMGHHEWASWRLRASESGIYTPQQFLNARETMPESLFNQEMECEFLEGEGSVFRGVREAATAIPHPPIPNHLYVMGVDLAKVTDYTVITVYDRSTNAQVYQDRFKILEWPFQKKRIFEISKHYNNALSSVDATGLGDPIVDDLVRMGIPVEPYKISEQSKKELIEKLSIWLEMKKSTIIPLDETLFEFDNFSYTIGPTGKIRYQALEGFHDDIVLSHALAVWQLQPLYKNANIADVSPIRRAYIERLTGLSTGEDAGSDLEPIE